MLKEILLVLVAFIWAVTIQAKEAFLIGDETIADISDFGLESNDSTVTKLEPFIFNNGDAKTGIYNLNGQQMNKIQNGCNNVNGKKVIIVR